MKVRRISVFMPRNTPWYQGIIKQIAKAFSVFGFEVSYKCGFLNEEEMLLWINKYNPQLIFEMNRPRSDIPFLPNNIIHLCWVVDFNGRPITDFQGSEITYLFGPRWLGEYTNDGPCRWLGPGACVDEYYPEGKPFSYEASFIGHIPKPWSVDELNRNISANGKSLLFGDILPVFEQYLHKSKSGMNKPEDYNNLLAELVKEKYGLDVGLDHVLKYDVNGRLIRLMNRRQLMDKILDIADLSIFGPQNWEDWPEYKPFYKTFLNTTCEMRAVYNSSKINFHENGNGMHFRVMDCMAAGGLIFVPKNEYDEKTGGIKTFFKPGEHYVEFDLDDLHDKYTYYLRNSSHAERVRNRAAEEIKKNHTWTHRIKGVLEDVVRLGYKLA